MKSNYGHPRYTFYGCFGFSNCLVLSEGASNLLVWTEISGKRAEIGTVSPFPMVNHCIRIERFVLFL